MKNVDINKFVGIKFEYGKSSFESCDCWGLVCLYYKDVFDIDLKHNKSDFTKDLSIEEVIKKREEVLSNFKVYRTGVLRKHGDIFLYENAQGKPHVAVVLPNFDFLETFEMSNSIIRKANKHTNLIFKALYTHEYLN